MSLVIDNFAGGGGASSGIEAALGRHIDVAINHNAQAIAMHRANHPNTIHLISSVWDVNPRQLCAGRPVEMGWFSPDCTFHSKARGAKPFRDRDQARRRRGLAGLIPRWMAAVRPRVVMLENVEEFSSWGPLLKDGRPDPAREGMSFRRWVKQIQNLGYSVDMRELRACDYGAPTTRKRLFIICRCDGQDIVFPDATHGPFSYQRPYRTAAECIDWSIPCPSIFERKRPLADATMRRIARGIMRYVVNDPNPFVVKFNENSVGQALDEPLHTVMAGATRFGLVAPFVAPVTHQGDRRTHSLQDPLPTITGAQRGELALICPTIINTRNGERHGVHGEQAPRVRDIRDPLPTVTAQGSQGALVAAFLARHYGGHENDGSSLQLPMHTITCKDHHGLVCAFLLRYYGQSEEGSLRTPLDTITTKDRFGLVTVRGEQYRIVDIGMRMLEPSELYRAQGFRPDYQIETGIDDHGRALPFTRTAQVHMCGNSVSPPVAEALVRANVVEQRQEQAA